MIGFSQSVNSQEEKNRENKMEKKDLKEWVRSEIEAEASALEQKVADNQELDGLEMPEDSFADLMARAKAAEQDTAGSTSAGKTTKPFRIRKRTLLAVALIAILAAAVGAGATGGKLFVPKAENRGKDGNLKIAVDSAQEDVLYLADVTEEEAYEEIEEKLGILALRLMDKPNGMEFGKVYIDEVTSEALMEFYYGEHVLTIYENKPKDSASYNVQADGKTIDETELFYLNQTVQIVEVDKEDGTTFYQTQLEQGNAYYYLSSDMDLEEFKTILNGIIFKSM